MAEELMVKITKWVDYNPRKDVTAPTWFRFKHTFFENSSFYSFSVEERLTWIYILCERSKIIEDRFFTVNSEHFHRMTSFDFTVMKSTLKKLERNHIVMTRTLRGRYADVIDTCSTIHNRTIHNITEQEGEGKNPIQPPSKNIPILFKIWNETPGLSKARGVSPSREKSANARWKEKPDETYWSDIAKRMAASRFCQGENDRGWKATFDFFLHPDTHLKVLEGKYDDRKGINSKTQTGTHVRQEDLDEQISKLTG